MASSFLLLVLDYVFKARLSVLLVLNFVFRPFYVPLFMIKNAPFP